MYIRNNSVIITECNQYTTEITSTIGKCGQIYIPIEVCNYFRFKKIKSFNIFIDKVKKNIILMPYA